MKLHNFAKESFIHGCYIPEVVCDDLVKYFDNNPERHNPGLMFNETDGDYVDTDRPGYSGWEQYVAGLPFNGNVFMDICDFAEKNITFRIQSRYDENHDGGQGDGLHIDDFRIFKKSDRLEKIRSAPLKSIF